MGGLKALSPPELLADRHNTKEFRLGEASLDDWPSRRARANQVSGATRTFVVCHADHVIGYYPLASGVIAVEAVPGRFRPNMPDPIPLAVLARLAVDEHWQGHGIGRAMFRDAARRVAQAADVIGMRGIVVHTISDGARDFYSSLGFTASPHGPMTLMVTLTDIRAALS